MPTPSFALEVITPEYAQQVLDNKNLTNRKLNTRSVYRFAQMMAKNQWRQDSPQAVAFDQEGRLLDGQHRLSAVVRLGQPVALLVARGCSPDLFSVIDTGSSRRASNFLGQNGARKEATVRMIRAFVGEADRVSAAGADTDASMKELLASYEEWATEVDAYLPVSIQIYRAAKVSPPLLCAVMSVASRTEHADKIESFLDGLLTGANLSDRSPMLLLRNRWIKDARVLTSGSLRRDGLTLIVRAWNAHVNGESMIQLKAVRTGAIPAIAGTESETPRRRNRRADYSMIEIESALDPVR